MQVIELQRYRRAYGDLLAGYAWTHFVTLTFERQVSAAAAEDRFRLWIRRLHSVAGRRVDWFMVLETGGRSDNRHVHALLTNTEHIGAERLRAACTHSFSHEVRYDPARGAAHYLAKELGREDCDYAFSPKLRRAA